MRKMRWFCVCMAVVMLFSILPFAASAATDNIAVGNTKTVVIDELGEGGDFYFTPAETARYVFWSTDNVEPDGFELDVYAKIFVVGEDESLVGNDDGGKGLNFKITVELQAGVQYYLRAEALGNDDLGTMKAHLAKECAATSMEAFDDEDELTINLGAVHYPEQEFFPGNAITEHVIYTSANEKVVKIVDGDNLLAVGVGTTKVTATSENGLKDSIKVTVTKPMTIKVGQEIEISPYNPVSPTFTFVAPADGNYTLYAEYEMDANAYAEILNENFDRIADTYDFGKASAAGFATEKGKTYYFVFDHLAHSSNYTVGVKKTVSGTLKAENQVYTGYVGSWLYPDFMPSPINAIVDLEKVVLTSSDPEIVEVHYENELKCLKEGTVTITATNKDGLSCTFKVKSVLPTKLTKTGTYKCTPTVSNRDFYYEFVAPATGTYYIYVTTWGGYNSVWKENESDGGYKLEKGESCTIQVEGMLDCEIAFAITTKKRVNCGNNHKWVCEYGFVSTTLSTGARLCSCSVCGDYRYEQQDQLKVTKPVEKKFKDVKKKDWFYDAVNFAYNSNLFIGTSETKFSPNDNMTRGMFVTVLGRLSGITADKKATTKFVDVAKGQYYTPYVKWASDAGIVNGMSTTRFAPDENITREQICVMMEKYIKANHWGLRNDFEVVKFKDEGKISKWAKSAVLACQQGGIINGSKSGNGFVFNPQGNATRAEVATILCNFAENYLV